MLDGARGRQGAIGASRPEISARTVEPHSTRPARAVAPISVSPSELAMLGVFLYGPRWQTALARSLNVAPRSVRRWRCGERRVGPEHARLIAALVRAKHLRRAAEASRSYLAMVEALSSPALCAALLAAV